jgi:hypothetical protein
MELILAAKGQYYYSDFTVSEPGKLKTKPEIF